MVKTRKIKVNKVPNSKPRITPRKEFGPLPQLYLELLENKKKVKNELINKDYVPPKENLKSDDTSREDFRRYREDKDREERDRENRHKSREENREDRHKSREERSENDEGRSRRKHKSRHKSRFRDEDDREEGGRHREERSRYKEERSRYKEERSRHRDDERHREEDKEKSGEEDKERENEGEYKSEYEDDTREKLFNILKKSPESEYSRSRHEDYRREDYKSRGDKRRDRHRDEERSRDDRHREERSREDRYRDDRKGAPSLAELEASGDYTRKKYPVDISNDKTTQENDKRELLFKFQILAEKYKSVDFPIPTFTMYSDINEIKDSYDRTLRSLSLKSSVGTYKQYMGYAFLAIEYILGEYLGFDMAGYAQQQTVNMDSYDKLLVELGEKSYMPTGSSYPVELRLAGMLLLNTVFFIIGKIMAKKIGSSFKGMNPRPNQTRNTTGKMKGPSDDINLDDFPDP